MLLKDSNPSDKFWVPGQERGLADEKHWNDLMRLIGAERIDRFVNQSFRNADYVWHAEKLVIELKNLTAELADQPGFAGKVVSSIESAQSQEEADRAVGAIIRAYMKDIICSANRQIKETKRELGLSSYTGVLLTINSGFGTLTFPAMSKCIKSIIHSKTQFRSVAGVIYIEDFDKADVMKEATDYIGLFVTYKMNIATEASMLMIIKAWKLYLLNFWLREAPAGMYSIGFEGGRDISRHWKPSDIRAFVFQKFAHSTISG